MVRAKRKENEMFGGVAVVMVLMAVGALQQTGGVFPGGRSEAALLGAGWPS